MNIEITNIDNLTENEKNIFEMLIKKANNNYKPFIKPKYNQTYYFISGDGEVRLSNWYNNNFDKTLFEIGNCFKTREEAEFALEKQIIYTELKRYALEHNDEVLDWNNKEQAKWALTYDYEHRCILSMYGTAWMKELCSVYFTSAEIARNAIAEVGEEKIKKYLFEVEE